MAKYRNKPVVIEAVQLKWENWSEICEFAGVGRLEDNKPTGCYVGEDGQALPEGQTSEEMGLLIPTLEGLMLARQNDWVIRGVKGELYPCKPDIFEATYEPVPEGECAEEAEERGALTKLSGLGYEFVEGQPNITGWKVLSCSGDEYGRVADMLVDVDDGEIIYVCVVLDGVEGDVAVPALLFELDIKNQVVLLPITRADLTHAPRLTYVEGEDVCAVRDYWIDRVCAQIDRLGAHIAGRYSAGETN